MRYLHLVLILVLIAGFSWGDSLKLAKGEALPGKLVKLEDGVVHFRAQLAGNMMVPIDEVSKLTTSSSVAVVKTDGMRLDGPITLEGKSVVVAQQGKPAVTLPLESVASIRPIDKDAKPKPLQTQLETGVLHRNGQEDYTDGFARLKLSSDLDRYLFDSELFVERADADEFPRWLSGSLEWQFQPEALWRPTLGLSFERDTDKALYSRSDVQLGFTRSFFNDDLELIAGLEGETNRWAPDIEDRFSNDLNMRLGLRYSRAMLETASFTSSLLFTPSLTNNGRYRASSESALAFPLNNRLRLKLNLLFDYEEYPQLEDLPKWRTTVGASVLWDF